MYNALYLAAKKYLGVRAGFIHVPFENGQVVDKANGTPFMSLEMIAKGLEYGIEAVSYTHLDVYKRQLYGCVDPLYVDLPGVLGDGSCKSF